MSRRYKNQEEKTMCQIFFGASFHLMPELTKVVLPIVKGYREAGHTVRREVKCGNGRVDIVVETIDALIECKMRGTGPLILQAVQQLRYYDRFFPGFQLLIGIPFVEPDAEYLVELLKEKNFGVIEVDKGFGV